MSTIPTGGDGKVTVPDLLQRKTDAAVSLNKKKITCLTAYDYPTARLLDEAGVDVVLVGDSVAMVALGYDSTLPLTLEEALHHTKAVRRGVQRALVVADMPYGSYHGDLNEALRNAIRFVKEAGAEAVKIEGGERRLELIARLTEAEIPVMGHVGLTPQSVNALGGLSRAGEDAGRCRTGIAGCAGGGGCGGIFHRAGGVAAGAGGGDHAKCADSHHWNWRRAGLRRADPGAARHAGTDVPRAAEICAAVCQRGRDDFGGGQTVLRGRAEWELSLCTRSRIMRRAA